MLYRVRRRGVVATTATHYHCQLPTTIYQLSSIANVHGIGFFYGVGYCAVWYNLAPIGVLPERFRMLRKDPSNLTRVMPA